MTCNLLSENLTNNSFLVYVEDISFWSLNIWLSSFYTSWSFLLYFLLKRLLQLQEQMKNFEKLFKVAFKVC